MSFASTLFVAEREHLPEMSDSLIRVLSRHFFKCPIRSIINDSGMSRGRIRHNLAEYVGSSDPHGLCVRNLLPPDNRPGTWDAKAARISAIMLAQWVAAGENAYPRNYAFNQRPLVRMILLGRRVARAFSFSADFTNEQFGQASHVFGVPVLLFPHPSGRSREWNEPHMRTWYRKVAQKFINPPQVTCYKTVSMEVANG